MAKPILVIGRSGQVARSLARLGEERSLQLVTAGRETADLQRIGAVADLIDHVEPAVVINAAAYTMVDKAESDAETAFRVNRDAVGEMAQACAARGAPLVHISSDYVFDGFKGAPYAEDDTRRPLGIYGRSKVEGEDAVAASGAVFATLRTSWVYSEFGGNFVATMLRLALQRPEIGVVSDQSGRPTWARDVAQAALLAADGLMRGEAAYRGVFHIAGDGDATWAEFAEAIFVESGARGGPTAQVRPIGTKDYPTPAPRPRDTRLSGDKFAAVSGWRPQAWRAALAACFDNMEIPRV